MQGLRIKTRPALNAFLFCERVRIEANGAKSLIGIFETLQVWANDGRPVLAGRRSPAGFEFGIYAAWSNGVGHFVQRVDMITPDGSIYIVGEALLDFSGARLPQSSFGSVSGVFQESGPHLFRLHLDDELVVEKTLDVAFRAPSAKAVLRNRRQAL